MKIVVCVLTGLMLGGAAYAQNYTEAERQAAREQATSELLWAEVVDINEKLIRVRTITFDEAETRTFISTSMSDMTQCGAFRVAQAKAVEDQDPSEAEDYKSRSAYLELHLLLLAQAVGRVVDDPHMDEKIKKELAEEGPSWVKQHFDATAYKTDAQKEHVDYWEDRCSQMEEMLSRQLEKRARNQIPPTAINNRTEELLAELHADG